MQTEIEIMAELLKKGRTFSSEETRAMKVLLDRKAYIKKENAEWKRQGYNV